MKKENIFFILLIIIFLISILSLFNFISLKICQILNTFLVIIYFIFSILFIDKKFKIEDIFSISMVFVSISYFIEILFLPNIFDYFLIFSFLLLLCQNINKKFNLKDYIKDNLSDYSYKFFFLFLIIWFLYSLISLIWAKYKNIAYGRIQFIFYAILLFLSYNYLNHQKKIPFLTNSIFITTIYFIIISLIEIYSNKHFPSSIVFRDKMVGYVGGTTFNMNDFATFLYVFYFFMLVFLFQKINNKIIQVVSFIFVSLIFYFLIYKTLSKANTIGLIIFFIIFMIFLILKFFYSKSKKIIFASICILLVIFIGVFTLYIINKYKTTILKYLEIDKNIIDGSAIKLKKGYLTSTVVRIRLILNTIKIIQDYQFMGAGPGNTQELMPLYSEKYYFTGNIKNVHNFWLELLSDYGIIVFILFILFYFSLIINLIKNIFIKNNEKISLISILSLSTIIGFIVSSVSVSSLLTRPIVWIYFTYIIFLRNHKVEKINIEKNI